MKVIIVRDRESAGGGISNYYLAVSPHLAIQHRFVDVGRSHTYYGGKGSRFTRFTPVRLFLDWCALVGQIIRLRPDLVHVNPGLDVHTRRSLTRDAVNVLLARVLGRKVFVFWRGWDNAWCGQDQFPGGNRGLLWRIYRSAAAHAVLASRFADDLRHWGYTRPIHLETTVVADQLLAIPAPDPRSVPPPHHLLFLSRVEVAKGVFELLAAYEILKSRDPRYTLTVAGDGPDLRRLQERVTERGIADARFTGFISGAAKVECYRRASIFCFPSYTEGMPNAVLEAMAVGLPIVSSDAGGLRDILLSGQTGEIVRAREHRSPENWFDPREIAAAIERLAKDDGLRQKIATQNWTLARERFAAPRVARRLDSIYDSVLRGSPTSLASEADRALNLSTSAPPPKRR